MSKQADSQMDSKLHRSFTFLLLIILISTINSSCASTSIKPIALTSFTENYVEVSIYLERSFEGNSFLSATFTPPDGYHLYSKDIALTGVNGLGRPTLLELTSNSQIKAIGSLTESVKAQEPDFEPRELLVYPAGPVTLSLRVELPYGRDWVDDQIQVTYMACSASQCKPPVVGKIVSIRIPTAEIIK